MSREDADAQLFTRLHLSWHDFVDAHGLLIHAIERPGTPTEHDAIRTALLSSAVVAYCRPFVKSEGEAAPLITWKHLGVTLPDSDYWLHEHVLYLRSKIIGHSDTRPRIARRRSPQDPDRVTIYTVHAVGQVDWLPIGRFEQLIVDAQHLVGVVKAELAARGVTFQEIPPTAPGIDHSLPFGEFLKKGRKDSATRDHLLKHWSLFDSQLPRVFRAGLPRFRFPIGG